MPSTAWRNTDRTIQMIEKVMTAAEVFWPNQNPCWNPLSRSVPT